MPDSLDIIIKAFLIMEDALIEIRAIYFIYIIMGIYYGNIHHLYLGGLLEGTCRLGRRAAAIG